MPELPEVETVRRGLEEHLVGRTITHLDVRHPRASRHGDLHRVVGRRVEEMDRRGKYMWAVFDDESCLLMHLGMSGQVLIKSAGTQPGPHTRVIADLDDGNQAWFQDQRTFGYWHASELIDGVPQRVTHIARDLLDPEIDLDALATQVQRKRSEIKRVLLNQEVVSGIGNIYADEMLWAVQVHPREIAAEMAHRDIVKLMACGQEVMRRALAQGGTSFDALYVNVNGESGYFARSLNAYGQAGQPCPRCGTLIVRERFMNRSSYLCPQCQRIP